ncbi:MAG TPA: acetolactate decarboxylase [Pirellulales bacterium]|nr:acetolactate decarboxylase [Pirellulales bacterium]
MGQFSVPIGEGLWRPLTERARRTGEPAAHIVGRALAEYLGISHHTLYQVSTSSALVAGIYQGAVQIATLREHGDLGLGTFENLDGELVIVDGHFYGARGDGSVHECDDATPIPFAVITWFKPDATANLARCGGLAELVAQFDALRVSDNLFYALRVDGQFDYVHLRAMCKTREGVPLIEAAAVQPEFEFHDLPGTLVGFWTPTYARALGVPGYHFHFLSADRRHGGHLLECRGSDWRLGLAREGDYRVALSENEDFLKADLRRDAGAELAAAEGAKAERKKEK